MKLVISTQHKENYGAHDWDGKGECPQYWKYKGGQTYVVDGVTVEQAMSREFHDMIVAHIEYSSDCWQEYVLGSDLVDDIDFDINNFCSPWEAPVYLRLEGDKLLANKTNENGEYGYMRKEIVRSYERWTQGLCGDREDYHCSYEFTNGVVMTSEVAHAYIQQHLAA